MQIQKKITLLAIVALFTFNGLYAKNKYSPEYINGIAAIVEDQIITIDELNRDIAPYLGQINREARSQADFDKRVAQLRHQALENLVDQIIVVKEFKSRNGFIPQPALDNEYNHYIKENFQGERTKFLEFLKAQGRTDRQFREHQKEQIIMRVFQNQLLKSQSEVSPEKINKFYKNNPSMFYEEEAIHLRQIVLSPKEGEDSNDLIAKANEIIAELKNGGDFIELAKTHSNDDRKQSGGDWGWINRSDIHDKLAETAFALEQGQYSEPIAFNDHVFIMYVENKRNEGSIPLEAVRDQIEKMLSNELSRKAQMQRLERFRQKAYVKYFI